MSSLRLLVPPLQLVSAALWQIVRQGAVMYFGLLEDFVSTVLETVPELLTYTERVQLVMGLRAKVRITSSGGKYINSRAVLKLNFEVLVLSSSI